MPNKPKNKVSMQLQKKGRAVAHKNWWRRLSFWQRIGTGFLAFMMLSLTTMYSIAKWYEHKHANEPLQLGTTFIAPYAESFGLDPHQTLTAILSDLQVKHIRLVSYWDQIEQTPGTYNFDELDWEMAQANTYGAKVSLAIGLRQPRWPECHMPDWAAKEQKAQWQPQLESFIQQVQNRYKDNPALQSYQLENEFFMDIFGICPDFSRDRLVEEYNLAKKTDPAHPITIARSNNWVGLPINEPRPDSFGISIYKRVWDQTVTKRYFEYPLPSWFYGFLAGAGEIATGKPMVIHELQAEPWAPEGILNSSIAEQDKSLDAARLRNRIQYAEATGMRTMDLWGSEWWYWRKVKFNDPSLWNVAKDEIIKANQSSH